MAEAENNNINEPLNFRDEIISGGKNYPVLKICSQFFSFISFGIKMYLIVKMWEIFPMIDFRSYLLNIFQDKFYLEVNSFVDKCVGWIGMIILSTEPLYQIYMKNYVYKANIENTKILNFFQISYFVFPFIHGFIPQVSFELNRINVATDPNFFVQVFKIKCYVQNFFIIIILICLFCVAYAICCGKGDKIGNWKTTRTYASGRESVSYRSAYGPDYEGAAFYFSAGLSCGVIFVISALLFFPLIVGMFAYVYNICYINILLMQIFYVLEFCFNILYINFYTMYNIY